MFHSIVGANSGFTRVDLENESAWGFLVFVLIILVIIFIARVISHFIHR